MSVPLRQKAYQPCGDPRISFPDAGGFTGYSRRLDLDSAVSTVTYQAGGVTFKRECFASFPDQVIVLRLTADKPGSISFTAKLDSPHKSAKTETRQGDQLALCGQVEDGGVKFEARLKLVTEGGKSTSGDASLTVESANSATLILTAASNFVNYADISGDPAARCEATLTGIAKKDYNSLLSTHQQDHQTLFRRVSIDLGKSAAATLPTDQRIRDFASGNDPDLAALTFQYGRYLLIACSRPGGQPANLQGIWNDSLRPAWDSKMTVNINTEMRIMKDAAAFFMSYLTKDPITGKLISGPSNSPEQGGLVMGPAMDHQIIRDLFQNTAAAARILGVDAGLASKLDTLRAQIVPNQIGKHGQLMEWTEDRDDPNNKHRHVSHLWAVYPGAEITPKQPDLFKAARQSLLHRGDEATGWSMGWKVNLWARFLDGDHANLILKNLLKPLSDKGTMGAGSCTTWRNDGAHLPGRATVKI